MELIKLVNLITEYRNNGDEESYFSLFDSKLDPNRNMPSHKITTIKFESVKVISDDLATAAVFVTTTDSEYTQIYTFSREDNEWRIADID